MISLSIAEYMQHIPKSYLGSDDSFWVKDELRSVSRMPTFCLTVPVRKEIEELLWRHSIMIASYSVRPTPDHPANAWLYTCRQYDASKLQKTGRYDIARAHRMLRIGFASWNDVFAHGFPAYHDTRARIGLSDGTEEAFQRRFTSFSRNPGHCVAAAWKDDELVAFIVLIVVNNSVEIEGSFSTNDYRDTRPNDGLCNFVLDYFLVQHRYNLVSYGLSTVQPDSNEQGLHHFKTKIGFEAVPVYRVFIVHPLLRPALNQWTLRVMKALLIHKQGNRLLKKAVGVLSLLLGETRREMSSM